MTATSRSGLVFLALISFASSQSRRGPVTFTCWVPLSRHITASEMAAFTQHLAKWAGSRRKRVRTR